MTYEEAIEYIEFDKKCFQQDCDGHCRDCIKGNDEYGIMASFDKAFDALKKQVPMKVNEFEIGSYYDCPSCDHCFELIDDEIESYNNYCPVCGQALDWRDD